MPLRGDNIDNDFIFIDFDGVILDSEERMLDRKDSLDLHDHKNLK